MNMKLLLITSLALLVTACATPPQQPVTLDSTVLSDDLNKIGVVIAGDHQPNVYMPGANCLLCIGAAEAMNVSLSRHVDALQIEEFKLVQSDLVAELNEHGVRVVAFEESIVLSELPKYPSETENIAGRDFSSYKKEGITHLLVIDVEMIGVQRLYASYVPTSDPKAVFKGSAFLVDVRSNEYEWFKHIEHYRSADGEWDESPNYPALTNAYYHVLAEARDDVVSEF
jgi:hypothetical protein